MLRRDFLKKITASKEGFFLSLIITFLVLVLLLVDPGFLRIIELKTYDLRMQLRGEREPSDRIAIVTVDEKSLNDPELGRWPWSRAKLADIINIISSEGASLIALDMVFAEPDKTGLQAKKGLEEAMKKLDSFNLGKTQIPENELNRALKALTSLKYRINLTDEELLKLSGISLIPNSLNEYRKYLSEEILKSESDDYLAKVIRGMNNLVLGYYFEKEGDENIVMDEGILNSMGHSKIKIIKRFDEDADIKEIPEYRSVVPNIKIISESSKHFGFFNAEPDEDGIFRWGHLLAVYNGAIYPSLALEAASIFYDSPIVVYLDRIGVKNISVGRAFIPTDEKGRLLINYYGQSGIRKGKDAEKKGFKYYSASDVLNRNFEENAFRNKAVFFGTTAIGIYDIRPTPYAPQFPGVEINATILSNIINREALVKPGWAKIFDIFVVLIIGFLLGQFLPNIRAVYIPVFLGIFMIAYYFLDWFIFRIGGVWLNTVYPNLEIISVSFAMVIYKYLTEEQTRKQYKLAFQHYLSPKLVNEILKHPDRLQLGGVKKELTVLFSDIRGFTSLSEQLTPEVVVSILNEYLTPMTDVVFKYDGLLNKYMGDAVMAIYGAPIFTERHAEQACNTALDMLVELHSLHEKWNAEKRPLFEIGIGINTGYMHVGNMGSRVLFDYTVVGDEVNLASRLEGINKLYGTTIIISENTYEKVKGEFICREIDLVRVKGKAKPVKIYELLGKMEDRIPEWIGIYEEGLRLFRNQEWELALGVFERVLSKKEEDQPSRLFIQRCKDLLSAGSKEAWAPVFDISEK